MEVGKILYYGLFDSQKELGKIKVSPKRKAGIFEIDYILSCNNNATSFIGDKSCKLAPNMIVLRKPNQISNSRLHFKCYFIHLKVEKDNPIYDLLINTPEYFTFINDKVYQPLFEDLFFHLVKRKDEVDDFYINAKLLELIYHLKKDEKQNLKIKPNSLKKDNLSIQKTVDYINENFDKPINLEQLGKVSGYSPNHFQRLFTDFTGLSPQKYLEGRRIEHAKYLLAKNEQNLTEIAYECGFSSQSYFSKVFKKHTLITPYEFMQSSTFIYLGDQDK